MAPHYSTLAWKIPWMEELGGLQFMGSLRVGHDCATSHSLSEAQSFQRQYPHLHWLLLLSRFSRVQLCATPETEAHQAPPSLGFSRQEHWSGLPFPSQAG